MFENPMLERLSRIRPATVLAAFIPVVVFSLYKSIENAIGIGFSAALFLAGMVFWTLFEYIFHRFIFHFMPSGKIQSRLQFIMHGVHHQHPRDKDRLVLPLTASIPLSVLLLWLYYLIMGKWAWAFFGGFVSGYMAYDMVHYAIHHFRIPNNPTWKAICAHHMAHHFEDTNRGFGVSSPLWDRVFRT
jgi:sterol desaturase/sphingolipid hydroxylase (fatty acid hydroxylase superfamily)